MADFQHPLGDTVTPRKNVIGVVEKQYPHTRTTLRNPGSNHRLDVMRVPPVLFRILEVLDGMRAMWPRRQLI